MRESYFIFSFKKFSIIEFFSDEENWGMCRFVMQCEMGSPLDLGRDKLHVQKYNYVYIKENDRWWVSFSNILDISLF